MNRLDFENGWPLQDDFLLELGRMTALWPSIESNVNLAIGKLMGYSQLMDYRSVIVLAHSNFQQRVDILSSLCEQLEPEYPSLKEYKSVLKLINGAQKGRNKFAHNAISVNEDGDVVVCYASARGTLKTTVEIVRLNDIREVTAKIHESCCALHTLITGKPLKPIWERNTNTSS